MDSHILSLTSLTLIHCVAPETEGGPFSVRACVCVRVFDEGDRER